MSVLTKLFLLSIIIVSVLHVIVNILVMSDNNEKYFTLVNSLPASGDFYELNKLEQHDKMGGSYRASDHFLQ